ncbi:MAG: hypothetical protein ABI670_04895 [Chloroflexota bacterium]
MAEVMATGSPVYETVPALYSPSWVDRVTDWVRKLPVPYWLVYLMPALLLFIITTIIKWEDGSYAAEYAAGNKDGLFRIGSVYIYPFHAVPELVAFYALALMQYLDDVARRALASFRPAMRVDEAQYKNLQYQLTNLPSRPTLLASMVGALFAIAMLALISLYARDFAARLLLFTSPAATVIESGLFILLWWIWGAFVYHTFRQLRLVSHIYTTYTHTDLFNMEPLYAFSWLTARTAIGAVVATYVFILAAPGLMENILTLGIMLFNFIFAVVAFAWPLLGIHRLLESAKHKRIYAAAQRFEVLVAELHRRTDAGEFGNLAEIKEGLEALASERAVLDKVYTWPWQRETVSGLSTALLLPIILWFITRLLDKAF